MGQVIDMFGDVDEAWGSYSAKARLLSDDPKLLCDRKFNEDLARLHERWRRLYLHSLRTLETA
jgi:hypothetical protein